MGRYNFINKYMLDSNKLYNLYIIKNKTINELSFYFNVSKSTIERYLKKYNIKKDINQRLQNIRKTLKEKYGVENISQLDEIKIKKKNTKFCHYGCTNYVNIEKAKQTNLKKYGVEHWTKNKNYINEQKFSFSFNNKDIQQKAMNKIVEKYGDYYVKTDDFKQKNKKILLNNNISNVSQLDCVKEKIKKTNLKKYGVEYYLQSENKKIKTKQTNLIKYGKECYNSSEYFKNKFKNKEWLDNIKSKSYNTKKKNNSFNKSKDEEHLYNLLCEKYDDVKRQYKSDLYPFACDFYIPSEDLYIEYNGHWTHGLEPYNNDNKFHQEKIKLWKSKNTKFYNNAIKTWTERDVQKRNIAKQNNLKWIELFSMNDLYKII